MVDRLDNALVGGGIGAAVGGIVPGIGAIARGGRWITGKTAPDAARVADDFRDLDLNGTAGLVSGNKSAQFAERAMSLVPGPIGARVTTKVDDAFKGFEREAGNVVDSLGTARTPQGMGEELIEAGGRSQAVFRDRAGRLYDRVDQHMSGQLAESTATRQLVQELQDEIDQIGAFERLNRGSQLDTASARAVAILEDLDAGLPFNRLKDIRSAIGAQAAAARKAGDTVERDYLNRIYGALDADMRGTTQKAGPEAERAFNRANAYFSRYSNNASDRQLDKTLARLLPDRTGKPPVAEDVFKWATSGTKDGATKLSALRRQLYRTGEKQVFDDLAATVLQRMGQKVEADEITFSASKMITEWGRMSPEAKSALFRGTQNTDFPENLNRVLRMAKRFTDYGKTGNHSNTANIQVTRDILLPLGLLGGSAGLTIGAVGAGVAGAVASGGYAVLLTNPTFIRWLAGAPRAQLRRGGLLQHVANLTTLSKDVGDQGIRNLIGQYVQEVRGDREEDERSR